MLSRQLAAQQLLQHVMQRLTSVSDMWWMCLAGLLLEVEDFPGWRHSYDLAVGLRKQRLVLPTYS
jgi:hypothetical protein